MTRRISKKDRATLKSHGLRPGDLGPPRMCRSMDAIDVELDRQRQLVKAGYLRGFGAWTYGWIQVTDGEGGFYWIWCCMRSGAPSLPCEKRPFHEHEESWNEATAKASSSRDRSMYFHLPYPNTPMI